MKRLFLQVLHGGTLSWSPCSRGFVVQKTREPLWRKVMMCQSVRGWISSEWAQEVFVFLGFSCRWGWAVLSTDRLLWSDKFQKQRALRAVTTATV